MGKVKRLSWTDRQKEDGYPPLSLKKSPGTTAWWMKTGHLSGWWGSFFFSGTERATQSSKSYFGQKLLIIFILTSILQLAKYSDKDLKHKNLMKSCPKVPHVIPDPENIIHYPQQSPLIARKFVLLSPWHAAHLNPSLWRVCHFYPGVHTSWSPLKWPCSFPLCLLCHLRLPLCFCGNLFIPLLEKRLLILSTRLDTLENSVRLN